ncbi:MAG: hypothetical protein IPL43_11715 [Micropruina sp.]|nr:hypothetical protein [Micropruina sp.]
MKDSRALGIDQANLDKAPDLHRKPGSSDCPQTVDLKPRPARWPRPASRR